jgi:hypothetical protein
VAAVREPLGRLLVDAGFLSQESLSRALTEQAQSGRPLGEIVVQRGWAPPTAVASMLAHQRGGEVVSLDSRRSAPTDDAVDRLATALALVAPHAADADAHPTIADEVREALTAYEARLEEELSGRAAGDEQIAEREQRIAVLQADLRALAAARDRAVAALQAADRAQAEQAQRDDHLLSERDRRIAALESALERLPVLESELARASTARDEALASLAALTAFAAARANEVEHARVELDARAAESAELRRRLDEEAERRAHADGMLAEREGHVTALEESLAHVRAAHEEAAASVAALSAFAGARAEDLERSRAELAARAEETAELRRRLEHEVELRSRSEGALAERDEVEEVVARLARVHAERDEAHAARKLERAAEDLRRAELERAETAARLETAETVRGELAAELEEARAALARLREAAPEPAPAPAPVLPETSGHVLFAPLPGRYALVERPGPPPAADETVELALDGTAYRFRVSRIGKRLLPGRAVPCAYLEPR